jgi:hypothetical protein
MPDTPTADQPADQTQDAPHTDPAPTPDGQQTDGKQQSFDADYVAKLRAENAKYRTAAKENADAAKRLAEIEESQKTESQKQADQLAALQQENQQLKLASLKAQVAAAKHIPDPTLLVGSTVEELEAHADKLLAFKGQGPAPDFGAGERGDAPLSIESLNRQIAEAEKSGDTRLSVALKRQRYAVSQTAGK